MAAIQDGPPVMRVEVDIGGEIDANNIPFHVS
jgi:hypothetical protein